MTPPAALAELLGRVEACTGPDRELDEQIAMCVAGFKPNITLGHELLGNLRQVPAYPPKYTASLDAALALCERVLLPALLDVEGTWEPRDKRAWPAWSVRWYPGGVDRDGKSWHAQVGSARTPALALLSAMLKALIAQTSPEGGSSLVGEGGEGSSISSSSSSRAGAMPPVKSESHNHSEGED
jgi:hypothetical protein